MKKAATLLLLALLALLLAACSAQEKRGEASVTAALPTFSPQPSSAVAGQLSKTDQAPAWVQVNPDPTPDSMVGHREKEKRQAVTLSPLLSVDLSQLNHTMAYAQMYDLVSNAKRYEGNTVRLKGRYFQLPIPAKEKVMHVLVVTDNSLCCEIGLEFFLTGDPVYPQDFPENNSTIQITGLVSVYELDGSAVPALITNQVEVINE